jgi:hypothetical protein
VIIKCVAVTEEGPLFDQPLSFILKGCVPGAAIQLLTPDKFISYQQIRWWKGILLTALSRDSGDSIAWWEATLKLAVMPDEFAPTYVAVGKQVLPIIPSISSLSIKKMGKLIEGSVSYCRDTLGLMWVTLPAAELKK